MKNFDYWKNLHENSRLDEFNYDSSGLLWLKIKSILRKGLIEHFLSENQVVLSERSLSKQFAELFRLLSGDLPRSHLLLDGFIRKVNAVQADNLDTDQLVSELFKLKTFDWGGDYQNSLDKYLVSRYVKGINSYDVLLSKFDLEINPAVRGYVLNSWYNHWSSILIEHIFKSHPVVLPTVGQIKGVDFFINGIPFDLKVTYLPSEFLKEKRKEHGFPVELTFLKQKAKEGQISYSKAAKPSDIHYEITEKMKNRNDDFCVDALNKIKQENDSILLRAMSNSRPLIKWLYENQGEMRFGSENRLFLLLVDTEDFQNSWKLKRNLDMLIPTILGYLNDFAKKDVADLKVDFTYKGKNQIFTAFADIIFVTK